MFNLRVGIFYGHHRLFEQEKFQEETDSFGL